MPSYSSEYKSVILTKLLGPKPRSVSQVSKETGISSGSLYKWLKQASGESPIDIPKRVKRVCTWSKQERLSVLLSTANMSEDKLNSFCRRKGLFPAQLEQWKNELMSDLDKKSEKKKDEEIKALKSELEATKKDLKKKEKALAEASAILFLKKKAQELWGEDEEEK